MSTTAGLIVSLAVTWAVALALYAVAHNIRIVPRKDKIADTKERREMMIAQERKAMRTWTSR